MPLDFDTIYSIATLLISIGGYAYAFFASRSRAAAKEMEEMKADLATRAKLADLVEVEQTVAEHEKRMLNVEGELRHMPDREMVNEIKLALADLKGTVGQLGERVGGVARIVNVIDETLRKDPRP